jgi:hypothetical protein
MRRAFANVAVAQSRSCWKPTVTKAAPNVLAQPVGPSTSFVIAPSTGMRPTQGSGPAPSAAIKSAISGLGFPFTSRKTNGETCVGSPWVIAARNAERLGALSTGRSATAPRTSFLVKRRRIDHAERSCLVGRTDQPCWCGTASGIGGCLDTPESPQGCAAVTAPAPQRSSRKHLRPTEMQKCVVSPPSMTSTWPEM